MPTLPDDVWQTLRVASKIARHSENLRGFRYTLRALQIVLRLDVSPTPTGPPSDPTEPRAQAFIPANSEADNAAAARAAFRRARALAADLGVDTE